MIPPTLRRRDLALLPFAMTLDVPAAPQRLQWPARTLLLDGREWRASDWVGQPALLVIWATHCPFCQRHNVSVQSLQQSLGKTLRILGISLDQSAADVQRYMAKNGYTFPVTLDSEPWLKALAVRKVLPTTIPVARDGRIGQVVPGEMFAEDLEGLAQWALQSGGASG